jgi:C4-type Zn-finger protein
LPGTRQDKKEIPQGKENIMSDKIQCDRCGWIGTEAEPMEYPPESGVTWNSCPVCHAPEMFLDDLEIPLNSIEEVRR